LILHQGFQESFLFLLVFAKIMYRHLLHSVRVFTAPALLATENVLCQQSRNTMILKRRWALFPHRKNGPVKALKAKTYVYELVKNTDTLPKTESIEMILTGYVDGLGHAGELVKMKPIAAYNRLLLPGLAVYNTPENLKKYAQDTNAIDEKRFLPSVHRCIDVLEGLTCLVHMNKHNPWVIEPWHIRGALRRMGIQVLDNSCIKIPDQKITGPDMSKENKEFFVTVTINNLAQARLRCRIIHHSNDPEEQLIYELEHWKLPAEPLFPEDAPPASGSEPSTEQKQ